MGPEKITTDRIILAVEQESAASRVLDMYLRNRLCFEQFEPTRPDNFYTLDYHRAMLHREYIAYKTGQFLRYYIYDIQAPDIVIGAVNFNFFSTGLVRYAEIGYKLDTMYQHRGIAREACAIGMRILQQNYGIFRFDARIHPTNHASIKLAQSLGFTPYRFEPQSANVLGQTVDIMRYSLTSTSQLN